MDSMITAAARALSAGDPLGALKRVALREDAAAMALRGIAMAQLGDLSRAKTLLKQAARAFGPKEALARARCIVAEAEIALVSRDLTWPVKALETAWTVLQAHGEHMNAAHARNLTVRRLLLIGRLDEAGRLLAGFDPSPLPPLARAAHELAVANIAVRRLKIKDAREAFSRARQAADVARVPAFSAEVEEAARVLERPAARLVSGGESRPLLLDEVEALLAAGDLVIDACRNGLRIAETSLSLTTRPVLFSLARTLGEAWPGDAPRTRLLVNAFRARHVDESHRARLRVEIGRLRVALQPFADIRATRDGFALIPRGSSRVVVIAPPVEEDHGDVLALLSDGEAWASSALSIALGASPRTVQRALERLAENGKVQAIGEGRARRWMVPPLTTFPTILLLPGPLPSG
ncbi:MULTISPECIES: hypothetical protein [unclassified Rhizobium]|uniref:hypothetical protein n=1 Tax=unclassified Rhizobium TaxID=2613769 RepID=UPI0006FDE5E1|nr:MULTISPECIES: hypothetical protein [unclassified Rhizobium]KQV37509.1 DNA-binding protein [Rhizobium sp. Root1212]KRD30299.1 DNA-binding protein [Rhizobium sp. Root268]